MKNHCTTLHIINSKSSVVGRVKGRGRVKDFVPGTAV